MKLIFKLLHLLRVEHRTPMAGGMYIVKKCAPGGNLTKRQLDGYDLHKTAKIKKL